MPPPPAAGSADDLALPGRIALGLVSRPTYSAAPSFEWFVPLLLALPAAACFAAYESLRRRARYREARALLTRKAEFLDAVERLAGGPRAALDAARDAFAAAVRAAEDEALARWEAERGERPDAAWLSPRATARRRSGLRRRTAAWIRWADAVREAADRGGPLPPEPGSKRPGAPIRRLCRESVAPMPDAGAVAAAFEVARGRGRVAEKIRCGSLLLDAEARVDSSLVRNADGEIAGRKPGLRGWLGDVAPQLLAHYQTLMKYRRLAQAFRAAHGLGDPCPADLLLAERPESEAKLPPRLRAALPAARRLARERLGAPEAASATAFAAALARCGPDERTGRRSTA